MTPINFPEANKPFGPPQGLEESQVATIPAYIGEIVGGSCDGLTQVVVAWQPHTIDVERIVAGKPIFISMIGGLAPHFPSTSFEEATRPA